MRCPRALLLSVLLVAACHSTDPPGVGDLGQECYPNHTCNDGLACSLGQCVHMQPTATDGSTADHQPGASDLAGTHDGSSANDTVDPDTCTPDKKFCRNKAIRLCAGDGKTSFLVRDCVVSDGPTYDCSLCSDGKPVCKSGAVVVQAKSTGYWDFNISYFGSDLQGWCSGTEPRGRAYFNKLGYFNLEVKPTGGIDSLYFGTDPKVVSGKIYSPADKQLTFRYFSGGVYCSASMKGTPPDPGSLKLTFSGKSKGSSWSLDASGYCYDDNKGWKPFSFKGSGIMTR